MGDKENKEKKYKLDTHYESSNKKTAKPRCELATFWLQTRRLNPLFFLCFNLLFYEYQHKK
jgi:hypothetical protein